MQNICFFSTTDAISNVLYRTGQWEEHLLTISKVFLHKASAPLVLDIGANLGAFGIPIAKSIQETGGHVIGFEPQRIIYYQLCGKIILNRLDNFIAHNKAVGHILGDIEIPEINYENNANIGAFSFDQTYRINLNMEQYMRSKKTMVPIITLDSLATEESPALIKIDVEEFEINVLKGGEGFLERHNYPPIMFEAWDLEWFKEGKMELLNLINHLGYEISFNIKSEFVAQHPKNAMHIDFATDANGTINMARVK